MVRPIEAHEHGGKLVIFKDKPAIGVMTVDEHAHRYKCNVEGQNLPLPCWG